MVTLETCKLNYGTFIKYAKEIFNNFYKNKNEINKKKLKTQ